MVTTNFSNRIIMMARARPISHQSIFINVDHIHAMTHDIAVRKYIRKKSTEEMSLMG